MLQEGEITPIVEMIRQVGAASLVKVVKLAYLAQVKFTTQNRRPGGALRCRRQPRIVLAERLLFPALFPLRPLVDRPDQLSQLVNSLGVEMAVTRVWRPGDVMEIGS